VGSWNTALRQKRKAGIKYDFTASKRHEVVDNVSEGDVLDALKEKRTHA
jgi:hypothetical protein